MFRLSSNSSDINIFTQSKHDYELALKKTVITKPNLSIKPQMKQPMYVVEGENKPRKILRFSPPYNKAVANKLGKKFFELLKKNCLPSNKLYKIFNKNTVKLNYSCMPNVATFMNTKKLNNK